MTESNKKDAKMAAAHDKEGADAAKKTGKGPFNPIPLKPGVDAVMKGIKGRKKKLPNVVETEERRTVAVRYDFTDAERKKIGQDLAQRQIELVEVEDEKKAVMASFTDRIKAKKIDINRFSRQVRDGWENRDHNTTLVLDFKKHEKRYRDVETKQIVKTEAFGPGDEQRRFV